MMSNNKLGDEREINVANRYLRENTAKAMRGKIERGLVELITNSDDSYRDLEDERMNTFGGVKIEVERKRKGTLIKVFDRAAGISKAKMETKLRSLGKRTSGFEQGKARRGLHGRGAKDVSAFGIVHFESVKDNEFTHLVIKPNLVSGYAKYIKKIKPEQRKSLPISKGNGTVVSIEVQDSFPIPQHESLMRNLSRYYSLRDICSNPNRKIILFDTHSRKEDRLTYRYPEGEEILSDKFEIPGYPGSQCEIFIKKHSSAFERERLPYREGMLIKSRATIHDCTYFGLGNESLAWRFSGEVRCPYIDQLINEYDDLEDRGLYEHPSSNPIRISDPSRDGLIEEHPFVEKLFSICRVKLKKLIDDIKKTEEVEKRKVTNQELNKRFDELSQAISPIFEKELKELEEEISTDSDTGTNADNYSLGVHIIPANQFSLVKGVKKTFSVFIKDNNILDLSAPINIRSNNSLFSINKTKVNIKLVKENFYFGKTSFTIEATEVGEQAIIEAFYKNYSKSIKLISTEELIDTEWVKEGLFFEKPKYLVTHNKDKTLLVYLNSPNKPASYSFKITSSSPDVKVLGGGQGNLQTTAKQNLYIGKCKIRGVKLKETAVITVLLEDYNSATANVTVVERNKSGIKFDFKPIEDDYAPLRYAWDLSDPYLLHIGAKHQTIRRYLGEPKDEKYPGIKSPLYHAVLAEVIAEAISFKLLKSVFTREGEAKTLDYDSADHFYHQYFAKYLVIAHKHLINDLQIKTFFPSENSIELK